MQVRTLPKIAQTCKKFIVDIYIKWQSELSSRYPGKPWFSFASWFFDWWFYGREPLVNFCDRVRRDLSCKVDLDLQPTTDLETNRDSIPERFCAGVSFHDQSYRGCLQTEPPNQRFLAFGFPLNIPSHGGVVGSVITDDLHPPAEFNLQCNHVSYFSVVQKSSSSITRIGKGLSFGAGVCHGLVKDRALRPWVGRVATLEEGPRTLLVIPQELIPREKKFFAEIDV